MIRTYTSIVTVLFIAASIAAAESTDQRDPSRNAALQYLSAFVNIPKNSSFTQWEIANRTPLTASMTDVEFLFEDSGIRNSTRWAVDALRRGARMPYCEWGLPVLEDGPHTLLHHTQRSSTAGGLLLLSARLEQSRGNWDTAIDDLYSAWVFYRHMAYDGSLVSWSNAHFGNIESKVAPLAASWLPELDESKLRLFEQHLDQLPEPPPLSEVIHHTSVMWLGWMRNTANRGGIEALNEALLDSAGNNVEVVSASINDATSTKEKLSLFINKAGARFDRAADIASLPLDEFQVAAAEFRKEVGSDDPLTRLMLDQFVQAEGTFLRLRNQEAKSKARLAMFQAACALQREGSEGLRRRDDPFGTGSFEFAASDGGFTLTSALMVKDEHYSIRFGKGAIPEPKKDSQLLIYDSEADIASEISEALGTANQDNKRILLQWGFNGCIPCYTLHAMMKNQASLAKTLNDSYVLIPVDITKDENLELAKTYQVEFPGVPHLTVLDSDGTVLANVQPAREFYAHGELDAELLERFLREMAAPR